MNDNKSLNVNEPFDYIRKYITNLLTIITVGVTDRQTGRQTSNDNSLRPTADG